jgi:hypothetical protein
LKWTSPPHLHGGNDDILTICTFSGCEWAENQLEMSSSAGIQSLSFWVILQVLMLFSYWTISSCVPS